MAIDVLEISWTAQAYDKFDLQVLLFLANLDLFDRPGNSLHFSLNRFVYYYCFKKSVILMTPNQYRTSPHLSE